MDFSFGKVFGTPQPTQITTDITSNGGNSDQKKEGETYSQWGVRWAGQTNASEYALNPALQVVVSSLKQEQANDAKMQEAGKMKIKDEMTKLQSEAAKEKNNKEFVEEDVKKKGKIVNEIKVFLAKLKSGEQKNSGPAKVNFWIGLVIVAFITLYLFIFYSSAAYSAFFKDFSVNNTALTESIFDSKALGNAFSEGVTTGFFILLLPFLFMGLGFIIYQFGKENGAGKYIKTGALYAITFIFDTLLSYLISKKIYDIWASQEIEVQPLYSLGMAFTSADFWIIIFCGFIAYVIWGLVFAFTMKNHEDMKNSTSAINEEEEKLAIAEKELTEAQMKLLDIENRIKTMEGEINILQGKLHNTVQYDFVIINKELNNFFNGWIAFMNLSSKTTEQMSSANKIKEDFIKQLNDSIKP